MQTVETIARYHSSQRKTDPCTVGSVSRITDLHQDQVEVDLGDTEEEDMAARDSVDETIDRAKCLTQNVQTVETIARYHSSQRKTDPFIVGSVSRITSNTDE